MTCARGHDRLFFRKVFEGVREGGTFIFSLTTALEVPLRTLFKAVIKAPHVAIMRRSLRARSSVHQIERRRTTNPSRRFVERIVHKLARARCRAPRLFFHSARQRHAVRRERQHDQGGSSIREQSRRRRQVDGSRVLLLVRTQSHVAGSECGHRRLRAGRSLANNVRG